MLDMSIKRRIDAARNVLVGQIPDPKGQIEQITTALVYKYMDDLDHRSLEEVGKRRFFVEDKARFSWEVLMGTQMTGRERLDLYRQAIEGMAANERLPEVFRAMFKDAFFSFNDGQRLEIFLREVAALPYRNGADLVSAYEYLLSKMNTQGNAGQFRTPRHIVNFIVPIVDPKENERVHDPACGTGGFLISTFNANSDLSLTSHRIASPGLTGYDLDGGMVRLSLVNMFLHGIEQPQIQQYNTLTYEHLWDESYDAILANPPFMSPRGGVRPHSRFSISATRSEVLFVNYIGEHLNHNGRAGIIVPEGIIFRTRRAPQELRKRLLEDWGLWAVVSLPAGVFNPYSGIKTSILFLDKPRARENDEILFLKVGIDGYSLDAQRQEVAENDLPEAQQVLEAWKRGEKYPSGLAYWVSKQKIAMGGDYSLVAERYSRIYNYSDTRWARVTLGDLVEERTERVKLETLPIWTVSKSKGFLASEDYFEYPVHAKNTKDYKRVAPSYFAYNPTRIDVGSIALNNSKKSGIVSPMYVVFRISNSNLDPSFLLALIKDDHLMDEIRSRSQGTSRSVLRFADLIKLRIPLPPLAFQQEIVAELNNYRDFVEGAYTTIASWNPNVEIESGWQMLPLSDVCEVFSGKTFKKSDYKNFGATRVLRLKDFDEQGVHFERNTNSWFDVAVPKHKLLVRNDILIVSTAHTASHLVSKIGFLDVEPPVTTLPSGEITVLRVKKGLLPLFLNGIIRTNIFRRKLKDAAKGLHIYPSDIRKILVPVPTISVQKKIAHDIEQEQNIIYACKQLIELREQKMRNRIAGLWE